MHSTHFVHWSDASDHLTPRGEASSIFRGIMPSNVTRIVCDIVPLWSGYMWGAQVMAWWPLHTVLSSTLGRGHIRYLLPVPGHGAPLPCLLLRLPLPPDNTWGQQQHCGQGEETKRLDWICWEECHFRIDSKVSGFNRRVESVILHLRSKEFQNQVNDFTEGRMRILMRLYWEKMRSVSNYRNGYHLQQSSDPANQFSVCRAEILLSTRILGGISSLFFRRKTLDVCCLLQKIKFNKKRTMLLKRK